MPKPSISPTRGFRQVTYPRLVLIFLTTSEPNASPLGTVSHTEFPIADIKSVLLNAGTSLNEPPSLAGSTSTIASIAIIPSQPYFDPETEQLSIAGISVLTPVEVALDFVRVGGKPFNIGCPANATATLFAQTLTINILSGLTSIQAIGQPALPDQIPLTDSLGVTMRATVLTTAVRTIQYFVAIWITGRQDLV